MNYIRPTHYVVPKPATDPQGTGPREPSRATRGPSRPHSGEGRQPAMPQQNRQAIGHQACEICQASGPWHAIEWAAQHEA